VQQVQLFRTWWRLHAVPRSACSAASPIPMLIRSSRAEVRHHSSYHSSISSYHSIRVTKRGFTAQTIIKQQGPATVAGVPPPPSNQEGTTSAEEEKKSVLSQQEQPPSDGSAGAEPDVVPPERGFSKLYIFLGVVGAGVAGTCLYFLHLANYNPGLAEQLLSAKVASLFSKEPTPPEAQVNSQFNVSLDATTQVQIAAYFIQFDLDKETGVRRSDVLALLPELGFSAESPVVKNFLDKGRGRTAERKRLSGCSMQEFAEAIEALILEEVAAAPTASQSGESSSSESSSSESSSSESGSQRAPAGETDDSSRSNSSSSSYAVSEAEDRVSKKLREKNRVVNPLAFPPLAFPITTTPGSGRSKRNDEEDEYEEAPSEGEIIELDIARLSKLKKDLQSIQQRSGLSEAQASRLSEINKELKALEGSSGGGRRTSIFFSSRI